MIREAYPTDIEPLLVLCQLMHEESYYKIFDYQEKKVRQLFYTALDTPDTMGLWIAEEHDEIIGFLLGFLTPHFFGTDLQACDLGIYMLPEKRGSLASVRLIKAFEAWAIERGAKEVILGSSTGIARERAVKLFTKLGFTHEAPALRKVLH